MRVYLFVHNVVRENNNTYNSRIFMIYLLTIDFVFGFSNNRQYKWHALIATVGAYTNIDLIWKVIFKICL